MTEASPTRVVVLGASNVTLGLPWVVRLLRQGFPEPLDISVAHGHGRSYGMWSRVLMRELPGLTVAPLWDAIAAAPPQYALLTDIGNDLIYGASVADIADWVEACGSRLRDAGAQLVMTELPMHSVRSLSPQRYRFFRSLFFPASRIEFDDIRAAAEELNEAIRDVAATLGARLIEPAPEWYGLDPIHVRRARRPAAWASIMQGWSDWNADAAGRAPRVPALRLWRLKPKQRKWFGRLQESGQDLHFADGTCVRVF